MPIRPLQAAALTLALTAPAFSQTPPTAPAAAFDRAAWEVIVPFTTTPSIQSVCAKGGALVMPNADVKAAFKTGDRNNSIKVYCVQPADGKAVPQATSLTFHFIFSAPPLGPLGQLKEPDGKNNLSDHWAHRDSAGLAKLSKTDREAYDKAWAGLAPKAVSATSPEKPATSPEKPATTAATPPGAPDSTKKPETRKTKFTDEELGLLSNGDRATYKALASDSDRADFIAAHQADVDQNRTMLRNPPTKVDQFNSLLAPQKKKFCDNYAKGGGSGAAATTSDRTAMAQLKTTAVGQSQADAQIDAKTSKGDVVSTAKSTGDKAADDELAKACALFAAAGTPTKSAATDDSGVNNDPCKSKKPGDSSHAAKADADPCGPHEKEKPDLTQFYGDVSNGVAMGLAGLVLGSFFGGPLVFAAFALAAGVGAYYLSKSINKKDDKKG